MSCPDFEEAAIIRDVVDIKISCMILATSLKMPSSALACFLCWPSRCPGHGRDQGRRRPPEGISLVQRQGRRPVPPRPHSAARPGPAM
jgi:hypothetical protein